MMALDDQAHRLEAHHFNAAFHLSQASSGVHFSTVHTVGELVENRPLALNTQCNQWMSDY